jgi:DNA-binding Lrp family transcriptional regulator
MVSDFDFGRAFETAEEFFGSNKVRFAGIDGTMYSRSLFDLMIFFGGAYAVAGVVEFGRDGPPRVEYDSRFLERGAGVSSVVPMYISEVPDVDQTFFDLEEPGELGVSKPLVDEAIISNATIANWIMSFAEYYLAYKLITDPDRNIRILLMDRTLSGERGSLLYDTSKRELWEAKGSLIGLEVDGVLIDKNDLAYGRYCIRHPVLGLPPARADYLRYAVIYLVEERGPLSLEEICEGLGVEEEKRVKRVRKYLETAVKDGYLREKNARYLMEPRYLNTWERLKKVVRLFGDRFFYEGKEKELRSNRMKIVKAGKEHWLTTLDLAFLTLFCLYMIVEECWKRRVLFIGLTKDTAARDFKRQLIPILQNEGLMRGSLTAEEFEELPNTDRMILQSVSLFNPEQVRVPWSLVEYDSAFKTMVSDREGRKSYVLGARRNRISLEKTFLKTYVQLSQASSDPRLRSNVLLTDRLVYPEFDFSSESVVGFWNEFGGAREPVEAILFRDRSVGNRLQNLIMVLLKAMTSPSIPEAFGHNKPLFVADKVAKWHYGSFKRVAESVGKWILNNHKLRDFVFYMSTFRERRARIEATRREVV